MCISIESNLGRPKKREKNSPRHIDLDILYADNVIIEKNNLSIPHPRILSRRFVLEPFAEIKPNLILPGQTKSIIEHLENLKSKEPPLKMIFHKW